MLMVKARLFLSDFWSLRNTIACKKEIQGAHFVEKWDTAGNTTGVRENVSSNSALVSRAPAPYISIYFLLKFCTECSEGLGEEERDAPRYSLDKSLVVVFFEDKNFWIIYSVFWFVPN